MVCTQRIYLVSTFPGNQKNKPPLKASIYKQLKAVQLSEEAQYHVAQANVFNLERQKEETMNYYQLLRGYRVTVE